MDFDKVIEHRSPTDCIYYFWLKHNGDLPGIVPTKSTIGATSTRTTLSGPKFFLAMSSASRSI